MRGREPPSPCPRDSLLDCLCLIAFLRLFVSLPACLAERHRLIKSKHPNPRADTSTEVLDGFREIAACTGGKSQEKKVGIIRRLLLNCAKEGSEVKFLVRGACPVVL